VQAPSENELKQIQKVETKLLAPKINVKRMNVNEDARVNSNNTYMGMGMGGAGVGNRQNMLSKASLN